MEGVFSVMHPANRRWGPAGLEDVTGPDEYEPGTSNAVKPQTPQNWDLHRWMLNMLNVFWWDGTSQVWSQVVHGNPWEMKFLPELIRMNHLSSESMSGYQWNILETVALSRRTKRRFPFRCSGGWVNMESMPRICVFSSCSIDGSMEHHWQRMCGPRDISTSYHDQKSDLNDISLREGMARELHGEYLNRPRTFIKLAPFATIGKVPVWASFHKLPPPNYRYTPEN